MSAGMLIDHAERIARAMRLEGLLINANAVPIPIDLMPSAIQGALTDVAITDTVTNTDRSLQSDPAARAADDHSANAQAASHTDDMLVTDHGGTPPDAIANGLQAARDAIHESLREGTDLHSANLPNDAAASAAAGASSSVGPDVTLLHGSAHPLDANPLDANPQDIVAQVASGIAQQSTSPTGIDVPSLVSATSTGVEIIITPVLTPVLDTIAHLVASDVDHDPAALTPPAAVPDVAERVTGVAGSAASAATTTIDLAHDVVPDVVQDVVQHVTQDVAQSVVPEITPVAVATLADTVGALPSTLADLLPAPVAPLPDAIAEAVTVPSLGGAGTDALSGLLQPASIASQAPSLVADAVHTSLSDIPSLLPIGTEHVANSDTGDNHTVHPAQHLIGSGLI